MDYTSPLGTPAFIWSLCFSTDGSSLGVGCWDHKAYRYIVGQNPGRLKKSKPSFRADELRTVADGSTASSGAGLPCLLEAGRCERSDRIYAISLDHTGEHMLVAGRDKTACLVQFNSAGANGRRGADSASDGANLTTARPKDLTHVTSKVDTRRGGGSDRDAPWSRPAEVGTADVTPIVLWEAKADDAIYTVALSRDLRFACHSGLAMSVTVLSGKTGEQLFCHRTGYTVWCLRILDSQRSSVEPPKLAYAGQAPTVTVLDLETNDVDFEMPAVDVGIVYGVAIQKAGLCWAAGNQAIMLGRGGNSFGPFDRPSYELVTSLISELLSNEELLLRCLGHLLRRHPSLVNHDSLIRFVSETCSRTPSVLQLLFSSPVGIGIIPNSDGVTALHVAMTSGGWRPMQIILDAILNGRVVLTKVSLEIISECICTAAPFYPRDFLRFVERLPLQPEPEIFSKSDEMEVVMGEILTAGSADYLPCGLWSDQLEAHRIRQPDVAAKLPAASALGAQTVQGLKRLHASTENLDGIPEGFRRSMANGVKAYR